MKKTIASEIKRGNFSALKVGDAEMQIDPRYFRPTEAETLLGDPAKAKELLGWSPLIAVQQMCREMILSDLADAKKYSHLKAGGFQIQVSVE